LGLERGKPRRKIGGGGCRSNVEEKAKVPGGTGFKSIFSKNYGEKNGEKALLFAGRILFPQMKNQGGYKRLRCIRIRKSSQGDG